MTIPRPSAQGFMGLEFNVFMVRLRKLKSIKPTGRTTHCHGLPLWRGLARLLPCYASKLACYAHCYALMLPCYAHSYARMLAFYAH